MGIDQTKVQFASPAYNIDKISSYSIVTDSFPSSVPSALSYSIPAALAGVYTLQSMANPYGKRCIPNVSFSLDGVSFYDQGTSVPYYNATSKQLQVQMRVNGGCSDSTIYLAFYSEYTATQTVYVQFAMDSPT